MRSIQAFAFRSPTVIGLGENVLDNFDKIVEEEQFQFEEGDVVVISSKVTSLEEKAAVLLKKVNPSVEAQKYASLTDIPPEVVEVILGESTKVFGASYKSLLVMTRYGLLSNAGVDTSNVPPGYAITLPKDADMSARRYRKRLKEKYKINLPVIIIDTKTIPLRNGTMGNTIGLSGLNPIVDYRGKSDLYGRKLQISKRAVADNIATIANLVMGETDEQTPFAVVRGVEYMSSEESNGQKMGLSPEKCLYFGTILKKLKQN